MIKYRTGDLIALAKAGEFDIIIHGCNCFHTFGTGIAKQVKEELPEAYRADCMTRLGDASKLGTWSSYQYANGLLVINAYTQHRYGKDRRYVSYDALDEVLSKVNGQFTNQRIGIPRIGAGAAQGNWNILLPIIEQNMTNNTVTIVTLP